MSPSELEEVLYEEPFKPLRLTLASGDQIVINSNRRALISGVSLVYGMSDDPSARTGQRLRIVSIPNIVLVEPAGNGGRRTRRRRR
jgi:hypothetical protein